MPNRAPRLIRRTSGRDRRELHKKSAESPQDPSPPPPESTGIGSAALPRLGAVGGGVRDADDARTACTGLEDLEDLPMRRQPPGAAVPGVTGAGFGGRACWQSAVAGCSSCVVKEDATSLRSHSVWLSLGSSAEEL